MRQGTQSLLALLLTATILLTCAGTCALLNTAGGGWLVAGFAALFCLAMVLAFGDLVRRDRRQSSDRCLTCGYDLRASPGRCPECGTPVEAREPRP